MKKKMALLTGALLLALSAGSAQAHSGSWWGFFTDHPNHYACGHHYNQHDPQVRHSHHEPGFIW